MPKRILVVDDDQDILEILGLILEDDGYEVVLSNTGVSVEQVDSLNPDLVLLDERISGFEKRGNEICAEIRQVYKSNELPVILISAERDVQSLSKICGANKFIKKPFDIEDMLHVIRGVLAVNC